MSHYPIGMPYTSDGLDCHPDTDPWSDEPRHHPLTIHTDAPEVLTVSVHYAPPSQGSIPHRYQRPGAPVNLRGNAPCCQHGYSHPIHEPTWTEPAPYDYAWQELLALAQEREAITA